MRTFSEWLVFAFGMILTLSGFYKFTHGSWALGIILLCLGSIVFLLLAEHEAYNEIDREFEDRDKVDKYLDSDDKGMW